MSKRIRIGREGMETNDGRYLDVGAVEPRNPQIPVSLVSELRGEGHEGSTVIGVLTDFERGEDGWLYGVVSLPEGDDEVLVGKHGQMDLGHIEYNLVDGIMQVHKGQLLGVHIGDSPCWDGMTIT